MTRSLKPGELAKMADLEKRVADLESLLRQIPTRIGSSESPRNARWCFQLGNSFAPGDIVVGSAAGWSISTRWSRSTPGVCGVVERVVGDRFLVVTSGHIDTTAWPVQPTGMDLGGDIAIKPTSHTSAIVVQSTRTEQWCVVFFDTTDTSKLGRAVIGINGINTDGEVFTDEVVIGHVIDMDTTLPVIHGGTYYAVQIGIEDDIGQYRLIRMDGPAAADDYFPPRFGKITALSGGKPSQVKIVDPVAGRYWTNDVAVIGIGALVGETHVLPTYVTTATEADAALLPVTMLDGLSSERTYAVGDIIPLVPGLGVSFLVAHSLNELRDVDRVNLPSDYMVLSWRASTKLWSPQPIFPPGGIVGQVLTRTGSGPTDVAWDDGGGGGISSVSIGMHARHGIGFSDGSVGPKTGDSFTLDFLPIDGAAVGSNTIKGTFMCADGTEAAGGQYPTQNPVWFPPAAGRNALLVADATTGLPTWKKAIEVGDTTNHGGSIKVWYASAKYWEVNASGVLTMYNSAAQNIVMDPVTNGIKFTYASGQYVQTDVSGNTTWYQSSTRYAQVYASSVSLMLQWTTNWNIVLNSSQALITAKVANSLGCYMDGNAGKFYSYRQSIQFHGCDVNTITTSTAAPTAAGVKGQMHFIY